MLEEHWKRCRKVLSNQPFPSQTGKEKYTEKNYAELSFNFTWQQTATNYYSIQNNLIENEGWLLIASEQTLVLTYWNFQDNTFENI